ncbi:Serine/threonine-protein phosphatase 6 regulatory subunit 2 [Auxenochlorella protothecoides]|uniref:Serine/threonine-protein phosphatase 6 regulatory subunit 2 n=1 Tax=Auxenochlorella protothecoides TaxID=3075 RepID=A0A087SRK7_AUXPR|nr:Serine/threonine-protein phosphatase 6 regulatory subunit 2 [Auxenochlorella protothecoides]KFM28361.1 Serine/threonine-protein phosphatase 6 regulatory subunit 2 [Auxenochlorella protothecoides]
MYWRVASPVDSILDKDNYTLEELLDEDELIQECKSLNNRLIIFLKQRSSVEALLRFLVEVPDEEEDDPKRRFKYPFAACEVFCCEVEGIFQTLLEDEVLMDLLFSLLASPPPLNCMLAGYFSRVVGCLLARHVEEVGAYLQAHPATLNALCAHCGTTSVAEVVLLPLLLRALGPEAPPDAAANVAEILAAVAQSPGSPLVAPLAEPEVLARLVYGMLGRPVGHVRLKAVELLASLLHTGDSGAEEAVMATEGVQRAMALVLRYPFNNALHHAATRLLTSFEEEGGALVREALRASPEWEAFVRDQLEPRNALESVFAWQCGRPTMHGGDSYQHDAYQRYGVFEGDMEGGEEEEDLDVVAASALATVSGGNGAGPSLGPVWGPGPGNGNSPRGPVNDLAASVVVGSVRSASDGADMADMSDDAVLQDVEVAEQLVHLRADFEGALHLRDAPGEGGAEGDGEETRRGTDDAGREAEYDAFLFWKTETPLHT